MQDEIDNVFMDNSEGEQTKSINIYLNICQDYENNDDGYYKLIDGFE